MLEYCEPVPIADIYADGVAGVENLGANFRMILFSWQRSPSGIIERVVVAKIVRPMESMAAGQLSGMLRMTPRLGQDLSKLS